jgi:hypothetical protein
MPQGELDHGEADAHAGGARGERAREGDGIAVDGLAGEVVLGEPDAVEADVLGPARLDEQIVDRGAVGVRRRRVGERQPAGAPVRDPAAADRFARRASASSISPGASCRGQSLT